MGCWVTWWSIGLYDGECLVIWWGGLGYMVESIVLYGGEFWVTLWGVLCYMGVLYYMEGSVG